MSLNAAVWPQERLAEGIVALARAVHLPMLANRGSAVAPAVPPAVARGDRDAIARWVERVGDAHGLAAVTVEASAAEAEKMVRGAAPALFRVLTEAGPGFVLATACRGGRVRLLDPALRIVRVPVDTLRELLCAPGERSHRAEVDRLLELARVRARRRPAARAAMLRERTAAQPVSGCWLLRAPNTAPLRQQFLRAGLGARLLAMLGSFATVYALEVAGWGWIGAAALNGRLDDGWLVAWVLALLTTVPLRAAAGWWQGSLALDAARILKQRVLAGTLALDVDSMRGDGAGRMLARVLESQNLEGVAIHGSLALLVGVIELAVAGWILSLGAAPAWHLGALLAWTGLMVCLGGRFRAGMQRWTRARLDMTHTLVEHMVGHRTRVAQEPAGRRDVDEDRSLVGYLGDSSALDRRSTPLAVAGAAGWLFVGLVALAPAFVAGASAGLLAVSLGGVLFGMRALGGIGGSIAALSSAAAAWHQLEPLLMAASAADSSAGAGQPGVGLERRDLLDQAGGAGTATIPTAPLIEADAVEFRHGERPEPQLSEITLAVRPGERVLVEGPSGGGKSTLAAVLGGLRRPRRGLLLLGGLDRHTLGADWHAQVALASQFHENHILSGPLAFNLLMGRGWPAREAELREAASICERLGLGPLLERMPAGLMQHVGETGWQLSHGERSRVFLARALLQRAPLTVLDESFAALDPETLQRCLATARSECLALMVIAHP